FFILKSHRVDGEITDFEFVDFNTRGADLIGLTREQAIGGLLCVLLPGNLEGGWFDKYKRVVETGEALDEEFSNCAAGHDDIWIHQTVVPLGDGIAITTRDITPRKRTEEALKQRAEELAELAKQKEEALAQLDAMFASAPVGFAFFDRSHRYVRINKHLAEINGIPQQAHLGETIENLLPVSARAVAPLLDRVFQSGEPILDIEVEGETPLHPGETRHWLTSYYPVVTSSGEMPYVGVTVTEITGRRRAEDLLRQSEERYRQLSESLEERVRQRTAELEVANRELEAFSYSIAHDLRAPLRGIVLNSQFLARDYEEQLDEEGKELLHTLTGSGQQMSRLLDDLLHYARLGRREINRDLVDVTSLVEAIAASLSSREWQCSSLKFEIQPRMTANADPMLLTLAFENLLDNSCKYTKKDEDALIEVGVLGETFFVRDNGIGFDLQYHDKLFKPFERLQRDNLYPGTGIGLANVKRIVERHGGRIWAHASPGAGATIYFTLS
ncbi:MAG TPA: PAS domain-containing protein, partial [Fimbriimonadaceae bacterium]|nr:PAS domain-containing protein [Fimbriimonadaceae bacterium]